MVRQFLYTPEENDTPISMLSTPHAEENNLNALSREENIGGPQTRTKVDEAEEGEECCVLMVSRDVRFE